MNIGFIPLRKGSKGIPHKNRKLLLGRPLFSWVLYEAVKSNLDLVYIFTDDNIIKDYILKEYKDINKVKIMDRSDESASDFATTEFAIEEFINNINFNFDTFTLVQATSPLLTAIDINKCLLAFEEGYDSAFTVTPIKRFFWNKDGKPLNYNYNSRPRRQEFDFSFIENGACYSITKDEYQKSKNRLGGNIKIIEMPEDTLTEIDEPYDFNIVESLIYNRLKKQPVNLQNIKLLCLDVDGVLTDGNAIYTKDGELGKSFSMFDGKGLEILRNLGVEVCVITSENSKVVKARMKKLKIKNVFYGVKDKYRVLDQFIIKKKFTWNQVVYIGDDINDLTNIIASGLSFAPANASIEIKYHANILLSKNGGEGAVREACNVLIKMIQ